MRRPGQMNARGYPARILDLLETDGGWLTSDGIAAALPISPSKGTVKAALQRLEERGLIERQTVALASRGASPEAYGTSTYSRIDHRTEWRFKTWGEWTA